MFAANPFAWPYFAQAYGGTADFQRVNLGAICTGRIGEGLLGVIDGRENGHVSDTVAGIIEEDVEEDVLVCS